MGVLAGQSFLEAMKPVNIYIISCRKKYLGTLKDFLVLDSCSYIHAMIPLTSSRSSRYSRSRILIAI